MPCQTDFRFEKITPLPQQKTHLDDYFSDIPTQKANIMVINQWGKYRSNLIGRWLDEYRVADSTVSRADGYFFLDLNINKEFNKNTQIELMVRNLLDEDHQEPKNGIGDVPAAERSITLSLNSRF